jgi:CheY-like chemotaxis protein
MLNPSSRYRPAHGIPIFCQSFDLVLLDLEMPIMDGLTFAAIREWELNRIAAYGEGLSQNDQGRLTLCVVSSNSGSVESEQCAQIGVDFFEPKPVRCVV